MRLGIFGGTFDPVHVGHLLLAEQCREQCALDEVWFIPAAGPPHKSTVPITPAKHRVEMLELAIAGHPAFRVSRQEIERGGTSYTIDTLTQLASENPTSELFFLMGADSLADLPLWRMPREIAALATLVAVNRAGCPTPDTSALVPHLGEAAVSRIRLVTMPAVDFASHIVRELAREGRSIRYMVPRAVECYIATHGLYASEPHSDDMASKPV